MNVLIVEDEKTLAYELRDFLKKAFYNCDLAHNTTQAKEKLGINKYDFLLLDLGLPDGDGLDIMEVINSINKETACIILTARNNLEDRIKGLDLGADDYLAKPFSLLELQSRMHAISRRKFGIKTEIIKVASFDIDITKRTVMFNQEEIILTKKEYDILTYLLFYKNRVLTRLQLSEHIWGSNADDDADSNYIDVHIKNIRKKLSVYESVDWLETVRGVGYKIRLN